MLKRNSQFNLTNNDLIRNNSISTIYTTNEGELFFIKRVKHKGCWGSAID